MSKKSTASSGWSPATAVSLAPLMNRLVSVLVKASLLLFAPEPNAVATVGGGVAAGADVLGRRCTAGPPSARSASTEPSRRREPFMRMHSLFGVTITPLTSVVSELPRNSDRGLVVGLVVRAGARLDAGEVGDLERGPRRVGLVAVAVDLDQRVAEARALQQQRVLDVDPRAGVDVEAVVVGAGGDVVLQAELAAEELGAVVRAVEALDVVEHGAAADAFGGQRLQLDVGAEDEARVADLHVAHAAGVVGVVEAAEPRRVGRAFGLALAGVAGDGAGGAVGGPRAAHQHDAAPLALRGVGVEAEDVVAAGEDDRRASAVPTAVIRLPRLTASHDWPVPP